MDYDFIAHTDGACAGNPGTMGIGVALYDGHTGQLIDQHSSDIGHGTNNKAEYAAVITALEMICVHQEAKTALIRSDSQLVINQITGACSVRNSDMLEMLGQVENVLRCLSCAVEFQWIPRSENPVADALASGAVGMPQAVVNDSGIVLWSDALMGEPNPIKLAGLPEVKCEAEINKFNHAEREAKFSAFIGLKTNGIDSYGKRSRIYLLDAIETRFGEKACAWLNKALAGAHEEFALNAMRWAARGLRPDYALKKAAVDVEMAMNRKAREAV